MTSGLVTIEDVLEARRRIDGSVYRTPLLEGDLLGGAPASEPGGVGSRTWVKAESLQRTGSFKLRGATNAIAHSLEQAREAGVVVHSSGNHAQAAAYAASRMGVRATCVMPEGGSAVKRERVADLGAEIVKVGPASEERATRAAEIAKARGALLISSSDDPDVIAGQGTVGIELVQQLSDALNSVGAAHLPDGGAGVLVLVPVGGGGLASGVALSVKALLSNASVWGVEPAIAADAQASLRAGEIVTWPSRQVVKTIADGVRHSSLPALTFAHLREHLDGVVAVQEPEIMEAMAALAERARLVVEPSGALPVAALRHHRGDLPAATDVVCVTSGGNVDMDRYLEWVREGRDHRAGAARAGSRA